MIEIREVLRAWLVGKGLRRVAEQAGVDRKTARSYRDAAIAAGLVRDGGEGQLTDELVGQVVAAVRPARPQGHGAGWDVLEREHAQIVEWVGQDLTVVKIGDLLHRRGVLVAHRTLHRYCVERTDYRGRSARETVPVADGEPGVECQIDFARMGLIYDSETERRRVVHALIFTAVFSRHMFVWLTFAQTLEAIVVGCEAAWAFFGGVFKVLIPDNMKPIVAHADAVNPQFTVGWLEYAQARGFATDPARVRCPQDKPRVERVVQYVRGNFFAGEEFVDLTDAQARAAIWCADKAGQPNVGIYAERLLDHHLPWTKMRQVYRLLGLVKRYGDAPVDTACSKALDLDVVSVAKIASMLERATENTPPPPPPRAASGVASARFARDPGEYRRAKPSWMTVIDGGGAPTEADK